MFIKKLRSPKLKRSLLPFKNFWNGRGLWRKVWTSFTIFALLLTAINYAVAEWYINKHKNEPLVYGTTFVPSYARYYDLDPHEVLNATLNDLHVKEIRLVSYWDD